MLSLSKSNHLLKSIQTKTIRWGIIGLGNIAHKLAKDLLTVNDAQLYAVASRSLENANVFASKYNAEKAYGSYEALVKDQQVDAVAGGFSHEGAVVQRGIPLVNADNIHSQLFEIGKVPCPPGWEFFVNPRCVGIGIIIIPEV